jgi:hypothetical protein
VHRRLAVSNQIIDEFVDTIKDWNVVFKEYPFQFAQKNY